MDCIADTLTVYVVKNFAPEATDPLSLWHCEALACSISAACLGKLEDTIQIPM